jgi:RNA polymerase sigma-70 factor (subfamily 1)
MAQTDDNQEARCWEAYLGVLARLQLGPYILKRIDLSGVIQQTLREAHRRQGLLRLASPAQELLWLRRVLAETLAGEVRKLAAEQGAAGPDLALESAALRLAFWLTADASAPSAVAERNEQAMQLAVALAELPEAQREALVLQHWHGWSRDEIAEHLDRTPGAVGSLIQRGLARLRERPQRPE